MSRADDSSLSPADLQFVEKRAHELLDRADAWHTFPVPIDDILAAANVRVAPTSAFDPKAIAAYIRDRTAGAAISIKKAISKVLGLYDPSTSVIHVDESVVKPKQTFLKLHETAHHDLPIHRRSFGLFQDCDRTLAPEIADQFEREANNFARFVLFKGPTFAHQAADDPIGIKTPMKLAKEFGSSIYAALREYVRTSDRPCAAIILNPLAPASGEGREATVRRVEVSRTWATQFAHPSNKPITPRHPLWSTIPIGRKMTAPTSVFLRDRNGQPQMCLAEAFATPYNTFILLYSAKF